MLADGTICSALEQEVLFPCVETFPAVLVITDGLKDWTVFLSCNKKGSRSSKEVCRCDKETLSLLCFSLELKLCLLLEIIFSPILFYSYYMINISIFSFSSVLHALLLSANIIISYDELIFPDEINCPVIPT